MLTNIIKILIIIILLLIILCFVLFFVGLSYQSELNSLLFNELMQMIPSN